MTSVIDIVSRSPPRVPEDLIIEILLRLPAKSLLRFTSACREWHKIIKNPSFERDHFHRGSKFTSRIAYWYKGPCNDELDIENERDSEIHEEIALERYEVPGLNDILSMHGPCYGIICVKHTNNTLALWNPTTKRSRLLPTCLLVTWYFSSMGFGLDPVTDDLKIVLFDSWLDQRQCAIYNSRNGAWNLLESNTIFYTNHTLNNYAHSAVLNGVCYWVILSITAPKNSLLAFDMRSDLFQDIELPDWSWGSTVDIIDDNLALISFNHYRSIEIWLMKEQGCWTKHAVVKPQMDFRHYCPVRCWKANQILIRTYKNEYIIYDIDSGNTRVLGKKEGYCKLFTFPCQYKESLISV